MGVLRTLNRQRPRSNSPWLRSGVLLALVAVGGFVFADRAFYMPSQRKPIPPMIEGVSLAEERIPIGADHLMAWVLEPASGEVRGTVLYSHGNAGNIENHLGFIDFLPLYGWRLILFDYRGYGASTGGPPTRDKTIEDVHAALDWTLGRFGAPWLVGQSLGASLSIWVGGERSADIGGVIAVAPFTSHRAIAREALGSTLLLYPLKWPLGFFVSRGGDPIDRVADVSPKPLLLVHGEADDLIPPRMSEELYQSAREPKRIRMIPRMGHNDDWRSSDPLFVSTILEFLNSPPNSQKPKP